MFYTFIEWFDFSKTLSIAAFCISLLGLYFSGARNQLAKAQELRRLPKLTLNLVHGQFQDGVGDDGRLYAFKFIINNRMDNKNAIATASLLISYLTEERLQMKMKFVSVDAPVLGFLVPSEQALAIPIEIDAHNTVAGWVYFRVPAAMLKGQTIEDYVLSFTDTHGKTYTLNETFLQEVRDAEV